MWPCGATPNRRLTGRDPSFLSTFVRSGRRRKMTQKVTCQPSGYLTTLYRLPTTTRIILRQHTTSQVLSSLSFFMVFPHQVQGRLDGGPIPRFYPIQKRIRTDRSLSPPVALASVGQASLAHPRAPRRGPVDCFTPRKRSGRQLGWLTAAEWSTLVKRNRWCNCGQ